jgi:hypothetical protein
VEQVGGREKHHRSFVRNVIKITSLRPPQPVLADSQMRYRAYRLHHGFKAHLCGSIHYIRSISLTAGKRILLEKTVVVQLVKKFPAVYWISKFLYRLHNNPPI